MAQLIKSQPVKVTTKDGECQVSISLELNINLNDLNQVSIQSVQTEKIPEKKEEKYWDIPDFTNSEIIENFGKEER